MSSLRAVDAVETVSPKKQSYTVQVGGARLAPLCAVARGDRAVHFRAALSFSAVIFWPVLP